MLIFQAGVTSFIFINKRFYVIAKKHLLFITTIITIVRVYLRHLLDVVPTSNTIPYLSKICPDNFNWKFHVVFATFSGKYSLWVFFYDKCRRQIKQGSYSFLILIAIPRNLKATCCTLIKHLIFQLAIFNKQTVWNFFK